MTVETTNTYNSIWVPKIEKYRKQLDKELEPYKHLIKSIDLSNPDESLNAVAEQAKLLNPKELEITNSTAKELLAKQEADELSAVEIYQAFAKRGAIAHLLTNCAMELFFDEGLQRAKELDQYRKENNGKLVGPLHGIPISLKELMKYGGKVTSAGYVCYLDNLISKSPRDESISIQILRKLGAVFYMRTSQPQAVMHLDTDNNIIGRTTNPFNYKISPGGSSGGESAAVALGSSVMGIGSDIGGSIRVPAAFCGVYGIRPTTRRVSGMNSLSGGAGQESILSSQGPLTRSIEDLEYYMDVYINQGKPWEYDSNVVPLNWRKVELGDTVTFGFMMSDTLVEPSDAIKRGLNLVQQKLSEYTGKKCVVKIIELDHNLMKEAYKQNRQIYGTSKPVHDNLFAQSGEPLLPLTEFFLDFANPKENDILENNNIKEKVKFYFQYLMEDEGLDFIVSPTYANVAEVPKNITHWFYSSMFNLIDYPNVIFGTGLTYDPSIDLKGPGNVDDFNPNDYLSAPISLQLTGKRFDDEKLVEGVKLLNKVLGISK